MKNGGDAMPETLFWARLGDGGRIVLPEPVCDALRLKPGDEFAFVIRDGDVRVVPALSVGDDPFACFTEWASEADRKGYAVL
jgi:bifunctional DNA-binding transcriptional regulator/antitoxin component of YhaV-PrlF toxin-antitoxin module